MPINSRAKGACGEREFIQWLEEFTSIKVKLKRNLDQVRDGGGDVIFPPFLFECKRVEMLSLDRWWLQAYSASIKHNLIPIVAFRQNKKQWEFLLSASLIGMESGYIRVDRFVFRKWINKQLEITPERIECG